MSNPRPEQKNSLMSKHHVIVHAWKEKDLEKVRTIFWETWMATYSSYIPESDLRSFLDTHYSLQALHEMFINRDVYGLVAEVGDRVAGCARCTHARGEDRFYLNSLYVLPGYQRAGIGTRLLDEAGRQAASCGCDALWLGVMQKNTIAYEWYKRIGFAFVEEAPFTMGATTVSHVIGFRQITGLEIHDSPPSPNDGKGNR